MNKNFTRDDFDELESFIILGVKLWHYDINHISCKEYFSIKTVMCMEIKTNMSQATELWQQ